MTLLQKIQNLQYYDGLRGLKRILLDFLQSVTALETNSVIVAEIRVDSSNTLNSGTLVVGRKYYIDNTDLDPGDDFSNVGFIAEGQVFTATGTTPTSWTNSTPVIEIVEEYTIIYDDIDNSITSINLDYDNSKLSVDISNSGFTINKRACFSNITNSIAFSTTNKVELDISSGLGSNLKGFIKIEVYN